MPVKPLSQAEFLAHKYDDSELCPLCGANMGFSDDGHLVDFYELRDSKLLVWWECPRTQRMWAEVWGALEGYRVGRLMAEPDALTKREEQND